MTYSRLTAVILLQHYLTTRICLKIHFPLPWREGARGRGKIRQDMLLIFLVSLFTPTLTLGLGVLRRSTTCIHAGVPHQGGGYLILRQVPAFY